MSTIRRAIRGDCPRLFELVKALALYERAPEEVTLTLGEFEAGGFDPHPLWWAFVAEADGQVVGFALYYLRFSTWKGARLYLEDLYVEPAWRGQGIGAALFEQLRGEAKERGLHGMVWQALAWNHPALNFYRRYPTTLDSGWVNCSLDD
ncbi:MAG: GNAT family N-acetyltransferase [Prevotellaceae bacterium]|jgi:GNAT superfamily N-acetyltransferase|nr:GNAT family N-acetyltransferase [Prevotellaceae bacterium]